MFLVPHMTLIRSFVLGSGTEQVVIIILLSGIQKHTMVQSVNVACETKKPLDEGAIAVMYVWCFVKPILTLSFVIFTFELKRLHFIRY